MHPRSAASIAISLVATVTLVSCSPAKKDSADATVIPTDTMTAPVTKEPVTPGMNSAQSMTGDPDHDFLRMMSDHHTAMIAMAHPTLEKATDATVKADARKLDKAQDAELAQMRSMLSKDFQDSYTPKIDSENQKMIEDLKSRTGTEYNKTFLSNTIAHHKMALTMIDEYLPKGKSAVIKSMAGQMKADQSKEIVEFQKQLSAR